MSVPTDITDLSTTASSNSPAGSESIGTNLDDYLTAIQAIIKQNVTKGADIASGNTISIPNEGNYFVVTGTIGITGINDAFNGRVAILKFSDAVTLTDSAGLILNGSNITTTAGDVLTFINESTGVYRLVSLYYGSDQGYATKTGTETLTNKTIVAASNTITTASSGSIAATELNAAIAEIASEKANLASPTLTGTPNAPTASPGTNNTQLATTAYADAAVSASSSFAAGTKMVFYQNAAPTGWTKDTTSAANNYMLRVTNGTGGTSGGTDSPITAHTHTGPSHAHTTSGHILTEAEMPSHTHLLVADTTGNSEIISSILQIANIGTAGSNPYTLTGVATAATVGRSGSAGSGNSHTHGNTGAGGTGSTGSSYAPKYYNMIVATKN